MLRGCLGGAQGVLQGCLWILGGVEGVFCVRSGLGCAEKWASVSPCRAPAVLQRQGTAFKCFPRVGALVHQVQLRQHADGQGLRLVRFSAQPEPLLFTKASASVHSSAQPDIFLPMTPVSIAHQMSSRQAEKTWTRVAHKECLR